MKILSIETSCDETAIAYLDISGPLEKPEVKVLGNALYSQAKLHEQYGGVYPMLAKREHEKNLPILLEKVLVEVGSKQKAEGVDFIAVTNGPGLEPALWTGITFAEKLGKEWGKPVVGINHMEGHIYSVLMSAEPNSKPEPLNPKLNFPAMALLVSGGHTEIVEIEGFGQYKLLGHTLDDAVGEAFDKTARMLGLPYPGGPEISKLAESARAQGVVPEFKLPRPMINSHDLNFSFSGLKTAVLYKTRSIEDVTERFKQEMALEFEEAVMDVLVEKCRKAIESRDTLPRTLIIAGGVASNTYLHKRFAELVNEFEGLELKMPSRELATDNALMIGLAGYVKVSLDPKTLAQKEESLKAIGNLSF